MSSVNQAGDPRYKVLPRGQVKVNKTHECVHCGRSICPSEFAHVKALLLIDLPYREVQVDYSCCRPIK
jgi:hypothetical protein